MKLFHLSDLHIGKKVNEFSMIEDQKYILKVILSCVNEERPDGIIVAGDIFDRPVPPEEALKLWDDFIISLAQKHIPVFAIYGNHDSAVRFSDHGVLVERTGIFFSPEYNGEVKKCSLTEGNLRVDVHLLPFIKPAIVKGIFPDAEIDNYTDACKVAIEHIDIDRDALNILVAHQFVTGASRCESEEISVGGLDNIDASVFDDFDYVALGHIHGKQKIIRDTIRYCGTPLKYSFSEKDHVKAVTVLEIDQDKKIDIREIPLVPKHDLREIRGTYMELTARANYENTNVDDYIHVVLTDEYDVPDAINKLRVIYPNIMKLSYDNTRTQEQRIITNAENVERKTPIELFEEFYEKQNNMPMSEEQRSFAVKYIQKIWENTI